MVGNVWRPAVRFSLKHVKANIEKLLRVIAEPLSTKNTFDDFALDTV